MTVNRRIFVIGDALGSSRARMLLDYVSGSPNIGYFFQDYHFFTAKKRKPIFLVSAKIFWMIQRTLAAPYLVFSDLIYILPMSRPNTFERFLIRVFKKKVIGEFYISQYDTVVNDRALVDRQSKSAKLLKKLDQIYVDICTQLIFLNVSERDYYLSLLDRKQAVSKSVIVSLVAEHSARAKNPYINASCNEISICWWGSVIPLHGIDKIMDAAALLKEGPLLFKLYLFTTSKDHRLQLEKKARELNISGVVIIDHEKRFSDGSLSKFLQQNCDIALGNFGASVKARTVMVNKIAEAASFGLPIISQKTLALNEFFENGESIWFCESSAEAIAQAINTLSKDLVAMRVLGDGSYDVFLRLLSKDSYRRDIGNILSNV